MDRRDRDRYDRNDYGHDYDRYEGYNRNDEHYHSARNLTDQFERDYQRERGYGDRDQNRYHIPHTYHEGDMGGAYERLRREDRGYRDYDDYHRNEWDRSRDYASRDRDSYSTNRDNWDDYSSDQGLYRRGQDRRRGQHGSKRQGYLMSEYDGTFGRFDSPGNEGHRKSNYWNDYSSGLGESYSSSRYGDRNYLGGPGYRSEDNWYGSGHRRNELNRYY